MKKHFVTFLSPGTFVAESTETLIEEWNIPEAIKIAKNIKERHGATPYGFYFITRGRREDELDSREIAKSGVYYLGGEIKTLEDVEAENDKNNKILISNMKNNNWDRIIVNSNSWECIRPLKSNDIVLQWPQ